MGKEVSIFCEDDNHMGMLKNIVQSLHYNPRVVKTGGVRGQNAFVDGFLNRGGVGTSDRVFVFRDRDFDFPVEATPTLRVEEKENKTICTLHRVTAENYLLSPNLLEQFLLKQGKRTTANLNEIFEASARRIAAYSAARHTLASFRENFSFRTSWTPKSGKLPAVEQLGKTECRQLAWQLVAEKQEKLCPISRQQFEERFESFLSNFDDEFFREQAFLIWFNGKDLEASIRQSLPNELNQFNSDSFYRFALQSFDFNQFPDLVQFRELLNTI